MEVNERIEQLEKKVADFEGQVQSQHNIKLIEDYGTHGCTHNCSLDELILKVLDLLSKEPSSIIFNFNIKNKL